MSESEVLYCYGVVENKTTPSAGEGVFAVPCETLAVLARRVVLGEEQLQSAEWLSRHIEDHDRVLKRAMEGGAVVPWRFGAFFSSEERVKETIHGRADEFGTLLEQLRDRQEWTVRGMQKEEIFLAQVRRVSRELKELREQECTAARGTAYLIAKRRELLEREEVCSRLEAISQKAARYLELVATIVLREEENAFFNVAVLIPRSNRERLEAIVETLNQEHGAQGLCWSVSGPYPPYSFVEERK